MTGRHSRDWALLNLVQNLVSSEQNEGGLKTIGLALANEGEVILLDEPFTLLAKAEALLLTGLLEELKRRGKCIVVATHELEWAQENADYLLVLQKGSSLFGSRDYILN